MALSWARSFSRDLLFLCRRLYHMQMQCRVKTRLPLCDRGFYADKLQQISFASLCRVPHKEAGFHSFSTLHEKPVSERHGTESLNPGVVKNFVKQKHIRGLASILKCSMQTSESLVQEHTFLIHMDLDLIEDKVKLILSYNIPLDLVREHPRCLYQTSIEALVKRFEAIGKSGLLHSDFLPMNRLPHLLECSNVEFIRAVRFRVDQRDALEGCPDQLAYLQMRLKCDEKTARGMLNSYPLERVVSNMKLKNLLDFLLIEAQRSPEFVVTYRKLLTFSIIRLRNRWEVMKLAGVESEEKMVYIWCMSKKKFESDYAEHLAVRKGCTSSQVDATSSP